LSERLYLVQQGRAHFELDGERLAVLLLRLVILADDPLARGTRGPCVDSEGRDAEVMAYRPPGTAVVVDLVNLVQLRDRVTTHQDPFTTLSLAAISASVEAPQAPRTG
jgi:hypothetical protein